MTRTPRFAGSKSHGLIRMTGHILQSLRYLGVIQPRRWKENRLVTMKPIPPVAQVRPVLTTSCFPLMVSTLQQRPSKPQ